MSCRDVTELKRLEEQLIQAEKLAAMGQMLAGVAHELNNPLTAILGVTELLREREGFDDSTKRQLDLTHRQARRAARIVQNLLEFSRPAAPQKKTLDVSNLLERTLQLHEHSLRRNNITVEYQPQAGLYSVVGDANQLVQVFLNLISNAEHAIREVREGGRIQIRVGRIGANVSVTRRPRATASAFSPKRSQNFSIPFTPPRAPAAAPASASASAPRSLANMAAPIRRRNSSGRRLRLHDFSPARRRKRFPAG